MGTPLQYQMERSADYEQQLTELRAENERLRGELAASQEANEWLTLCLYAGQRLAVYVLGNTLQGLTTKTRTRITRLAKEFEKEAHAPLREGDKWPSCAPCCGR